MWTGVLTRALPYLLVVGIVVHGYWKWTSMEDTIEAQKQLIAAKQVEIEHRDMAISIMSNNLEEMEKLYEAEKKQAVSEAGARTEKKSIEEGVKYDKNTSVDVNATRYYIGNW